MPDFLHSKDAIAGMTVRTDGGFTCIKEDAVRTLAAGTDGLLFFRCSRGEHYLAGQVDENGFLIGLFANMSQNAGS